MYIWRWCFWHAKRMSRAACKAGRLRAALPSQRPVATFHIEVRPKGPSWAKSLKWSLVLSYSATASIESFNSFLFVICNDAMCVFDSLILFFVLADSPWAAGVLHNWPLTMNAWFWAKEKNSATASLVKDSVSSLLSFFGISQTTMYSTTYFNNIVYVVRTCAA